MSEAIFGLLGVIMGVIVTLIIHQQQRRDGYLFAIVRERLSTAQEAYNWSVRMKSVVHGDEEIKSEILSEVRKWFNNNNLYLPPDIRHDFDKIINSVWNYREELLYYYQLKQEGKKEEAKKQHGELMQNFAEIKSLPQRIEESVAIYYDYEKKWSGYGILRISHRPKRNSD